MGERKVLNKYYPPVSLSGLLVGVSPSPKDLLLLLKVAGR
jgi:hypothetical protein